MEDVGGGNDSEQQTSASCNDVKDLGTDDCQKPSSDDAELDDILDGSLIGLKITSHVCRAVA